MVPLPLVQPQTPADSGDLHKFLMMFPDHLQVGITNIITQESLEDNTSWGDLVEIVLDFGRPLVVRFTNKAVKMDGKIESSDINAVISRLGIFADDNRAGIEGTLHRISAIRNRKGDIIGLTCRVGRAITGTIQPIRDLIESGKSILFLGRPGVGKAQPLECKVLTPTGFVRMGDIVPGSRVVVPRDGTYATVTEVFPQGSINCYGIEFSDGTYTECSSDHLWCIMQGGVTNVLPLRDIIHDINNGQGADSDAPCNTFIIPITAPVQFENDKHIDGKIIEDLTQVMVQIDMIPEYYLYSNLENRIALLQSVMDNYGSVQPWSLAVSNVGIGMLNSIAYLVRSLGGIAIIDTSMNCATCNIVLPKDIVPFTAVNKLEKYIFMPEVSDVLAEKRIIRISAVGKKECQCIYVDHPDHLYITDNFIVTHNTTKLREAARVLADDYDKRVVIVDTSNEIAGDGDIPHIAIGNARRMQVARVAQQHDVMQEAVCNHQPEVIVIDEIGNELEAMASRTISERGIQLIATAHGNTLEELMRNPSLNDLMGGIQPVILGDAEAKRRGTQKTVLERKQPPTFDILIELLDRHTMVIHHDVCEAVDACLRDDVVPREIRKITDDGSITVSINTDEQTEKSVKSRVEKIRDRVNSNCIKIFPYGLGKERVEQAVRRMGPRFQLVHTIEEASYILARTRMIDRNDQNLSRVQANGATIIPIRTNNYDLILAALEKLKRDN